MTGAVKDILSPVMAPVMGNADHVSPGAVSLPAVPAYRQGKGQEKNGLAEALKNILPELAALLDANTLAGFIDPEGKDKGALSEKSAATIKSIKEFMAITKKRLGGEVMMEGIAKSLVDYLPQKGPAWLSGMAGRDLEAEAKTFSGFMNNGGLQNVGEGFSTLAKELNIKEYAPGSLKEAFGMPMKLGSSFFGNIFVKQMEFGRMPGDPALGGGMPAKEREVKDSFQFTVEYKHNTLIIKDETFAANPVFLKNDSEIEGVMEKHFQKYLALTTRNTGSKMDIQLLMEYNLVKSIAEPLITR